MSTILAIYKKDTAPHFESEPKNRPGPGRDFVVVASSSSSSRCRQLRPITVGAAGAKLYTTVRVIS